MLKSHDGTFTRAGHHWINQIIKRILEEKSNKLETMDT